MTETVTSYPPPRASTGPSVKLKAKRWAISKHQLLAIFGGLGLFIFGLSGLLHVVMVTWGPQQAVMMPPRAPMDMAAAAPIQSTLTKAGITTAAAVKVIAGEGRSLLQVTQDQLSPRRYFDLKTGAELPGHDEAQARYLARHYLATNAAITGTEFITDFTPAYPWVNRLLPVYRVDFDLPGNVSIYIYTETNASAGVSNNFKRAVQTGFRWLHTWDWIPLKADWVRVLLITGLVGALLALVITGIMMLITIRRRKRARGGRHWHRVAGYALALPLLMFTSSGLYHLLTFSGPPPQRVLTLAQQLDVSQMSFPLSAQWAAMTDGVNVNNVSIVAGPGGQFLYRLGIAKAAGPMQMAAGEMREARYKGTPTTGPAVYIDAASGAPALQGDKAMAQILGAQFTGIDSPKAMALVTRFGPLYDFRNKRLPVWQLDYGPPANKTIWVDTATGALVDVLADSARPERWSFSLLHKWNFLRPLRGVLGRHGTNVIITTAVLSSVGLMGGIGLSLYLKNRRRKQA
ncbi:MAG: hypothetical protein AAF862_04430 [Pseudomonadota bacterium]